MASAYKKHIASTFASFCLFPDEMDIVNNNGYSEQSSFFVVQVICRELYLPHFNISLKRMSSHLLYWS